MTGPTWNQNFHDDLGTLMMWRRDVRQFEPTAVDEDLLQSCLKLACAGPSVGYSQPWRLIRVRNDTVREKLHQNYLSANKEALAGYTDDKAAAYAKLKLAGLDDAPVQISVFIDPETTTGHGVGSRTMPETKAYSAVCMIQSLWLLLRAHGIGMGWVSILEPKRLNSDLDLPNTWTFVGHLCIGYPKNVSDQPELERIGWETRLDTDDILFER